MRVRRGIERTVPVVVDAVRAHAVQIRDRQDLARIATLAASDDDAIGEVIADAVAHVGRSGIVTTEESDTLGMSVDVVDGIEFDHGYISGYMVTDPERMESVHENPLVLLTNKKISHVQDIMPSIEAAKRADRPLVVLAEDVDGPALHLLVGGNMHKTMQSVVVRAPGFGHRRVAELEDLAVALGGHVVAKDTGIELSEVTREHLARAIASRSPRTTRRSSGVTAIRISCRPASRSSRPSCGAPASTPIRTRCNCGWHG